MRAFLYIGLLAFCGCATLSQAERDAIACRKDPVCYQMAKERADLAKEVIGIINPIAGAASGAFIFSIGLWFGGRKKRIENERQRISETLKTI